MVLEIYRLAYFEKKETFDILDINTKTFLLHSKYFTENSDKLLRRLENF